MASVMAAHFKPYGWIFLAVGLLFIRGLQSKSIHDARVTWRTWYILYSIACLLCFASGMLALAVVNTLRVFLKVRSFTKPLMLVLFALMAVRTTSNVATAFFGSPAMVAFFRKSAEYEKRTAFRREHHGGRSWMSYPLRFLFVLTFIAHIVMRTRLSGKAWDVPGNPFHEYAIKAAVLLFNSLCFVYDALHFLALRPCCEVLVSYIRHQGVKLRSLLPTTTGDATDVKPTDDNGELECVRMNLRSIVELKKMLNDVWQYSIVASAAAILAITCFSAHCLFDGGIRTDQLLAIVAYSLYSAVDFADVARLSQKMSNEIAYLRYSIRPEDMYLTGGNYFKLNLPLLVSFYACHRGFVMASVMAAHFKPYGWIFRAVGLFFVQGLQSRSVHDIRVAWKTWYTLYSIACLLFFTSGELAVAVANTVRVFLRVRSFTKPLLLVLFAVMTVRMALNVATAFFGSRAMVQFFRKSAEYEKRTAFRREHHGARPLMSYLPRFLFVAVFIGHIVVRTRLSSRAWDAAGNPFLEYAIKAGNLMFNSLCFVYDALHFVALRPCCEVLVSYIRHQGVKLRSLLPLTTGDATDVKPTDNGELECVRMNLRFLVELKKGLNDVWQNSVVASAVAILAITCFTAYSLFDGGIHTEQLLGVTAYCFYSAIDFADVARLSQNMSNELAGSVITYTVILVQTSDTVDQLTPPRINHTGAH
ncbi:hypothetical protein HPB50_008403 [Hyalomma asiaticum]|uniref:Uncharacterized protein n=1 Tax=Hyalomma asiaticum TaxID=266040 RepID=A0ACB7RPZ2_HYAAI|nr:hypothetical protein HPB50_008403 [Hyalomma asiaticum]